VKIGPAVRLGRRIEKKGKDRTVKNHKVVIFRLFGGEASPPLYQLTETKICMAGNLAEIIIYANFQGDILGVTILHGVEFFILLSIFVWVLQQCSATVLPVIAR